MRCGVRSSGVSDHTTSRTENALHGANKAFVRKAMVEKGIFAAVVPELEYILDESVKITADILRKAPPDASTEPLVHIAFARLQCIVGVFMCDGRRADVSAVS